VRNGEVAELMFESIEPMHQEWRALLLLGVRLAT
jgi:hypothetical protein